jgi:Skp family chaperone for outer membrane proteins
MKKFSKLMTIAMACVLAAGSVNIASAATTNGFKYAVVDVPQVVANSKQVAALKTQQEAKVRDFSKALQDAQKQVQAETNADKKKALETKLTKSLNDKKAAIDKEYVAKLAEIDKSISAVIAQQAKAGGYQLVIAKGVVLYSEGTDITTSVMNAVK